MIINHEYIRAIANDVRAALGDDFDEETFLDTLDGETDATDILSVLIQERQEAEAHVLASKEMASNYTARAKRLANKSSAMKSAIHALLLAIGERKISHPLATISIVKGREGVEIINDKDVPRRLCKVTHTPDKAAIKAQIDAGEKVPGAILTTSPESVSIRIK